MKRYRVIYIKTNKKSELFLKLNRINVRMRNIHYTSEGVVLEILDTDIKRLKKYLISYKWEIVDEVGL